MLKRIRDHIQENKYKIMAGISVGLAGYAFYQYMLDQNRIKLSAFLEALEQNQLSQVVIKGQNVYFRSELSEWYYSNISQYPISMLFNKLKQSPLLTYTCEDDTNYMPILSIMATGAISYFTLRLMLPEQFGKIKKSPKIVNNFECFDHFYGSEQVKAHLKQLIQFFKDNQKYSKLGGRLRRGILFHGPPGTGKTMLAKTLANEAKLPFIETCASQFEQIYVGVGPKKIRQIFQTAKQYKNGCIIFIDELDAIGSRSSDGRFSRETTATINQLLTQLDGFTENHNIVVVGATNRVDLIDPALIRAGRFDIKIRLNLPDEKSRIGIFKTLLKKKHVPHQISEIGQKQMSQKTVGWSGADVQTLINESIYRAVGKGLSIVGDKQIIESLNQMIYNSKYK